MATGVVDIFLVYQFLKRLATPFEKWDAFKEGIIDKEGNILMKKRERTTPAQKKAFQIFDLMILKLKRLMGKFQLFCLVIQMWCLFQKAGLLTLLRLPSKMINYMEEALVI